MLGVDQVVGRVGVERRAAWRRGPARLRIGQRDVLRQRLRKRSPSSASRYSRTARVLSAGSFQSTASAAGHSALPAGIGRDDAGVHRKAFALDQTGGHAAAHDFIEQPSEGRAVAEAAMAILGERRMLGYGILQDSDDRTSDRPGSAVPLRTAASPSECRSSSPRSASGSSAPDRSTGARCGCRRPRGGGAARPGRGSDRCGEEDDQLECGFEIERVEQLVLHPCLLTHHLDTPLVKAHSYDIRVRESSIRFFKCKGLPRPEATLELRGIECQD